MQERIPENRRINPGFCKMIPDCETLKNNL